MLYDVVKGTMLINAGRGIEVVATRPLTAEKNLEERICTLVKEIVDSIISGAKHGRDLEDQICSLSVGYNSPALKLQQYVACDDAAGWCPPDLSAELTEEEYEAMVDRGDERIEIRPLRDKRGRIYSLTIVFTCRVEELQHERIYSGRCNIYVRKFKRIFRRQSRRQAAA